MEPIYLSIPGTDFLGSPGAAAVLEREVLPRYVPQRRWFGGKARDPQQFGVAEMLPIDRAATARMLLIEARYANGAPELYLMPVRVSRKEEAGDGDAVIAKFTDQHVLADALHDESFR